MAYSGMPWLNTLIKKMCQTKIPTLSRRVKIKLIVSFISFLISIIKIVKQTVF